MKNLRLNDAEIKNWCLRALEKRKDIHFSIEEYAEKGLVDELETNIEYFKIDLLVDVIQFMTKKGWSFSCYNVAFRIEYILNPLFKEMTKYHLLKAKTTQFKSQPPINRSLLRQRKKYCDHVEKRK